MSLIEYDADSGHAVTEPPHDTEAIGPTFELLDITLIVSSPTNPRKHFDQVKLQELADSIQAAGVHQPVLVRPLPASRMEDTFRSRKPGAQLPTHELVAGERRWRACAIAGVSRIPAMVKPMTDAQVLECQIVENLQRDDLTPLEEADGYQALIEATGIAKEDIGARIGRSRTYVYGRLKLLDLAANSAAALRKGDIDASRALAIARIPDEALQAKALAEATRKSYNGEVISYREFLRWLQNNVMLQLDGARFKITDASLVPAAGSCKECSKRTGANPDLFSDVNRADVCTDPKCFQGKVEAHDAAVRSQALADGCEVITGKQAKKLWGYEHQPIDGFVRLDKPDYRVDSKKPLAKVLGKNAPQPTMIEHPRTGELVAVLPTDVVNEQLQAMELISPREAKAGKAEKKAQDKRTLLEKFERTWRRAAVAKLHAVGSTIAIDGLHVEVQRQMALHLVPSLRQDERAIYGELFGIGKVAQADGIRDHVRAAGVEDIDLVCMILLALQDTTNNVDYHGKATETPRLEAIAAQLEVDLQVVRDEAKEALKPKAKAPAKKAAVKAPPAADIKYRGPNGETWTGKGKQPVWVRTMLAAGATLEGLAVAAPTDAAAGNSLAVGTAVRFKDGIKGPAGKFRKVSGRTGKIEKVIGAHTYSVRFGKKPGDTAVAEASEIEAITTTEDAQAGIAKALQGLEPVQAWPLPPREDDGRAAA